MVVLHQNTSRSQLNFGKLVIKIPLFSQYFDIFALRADLVRTNKTRK